MAPTKLEIDLALAKATLEVVEALEKALPGWRAKDAARQAKVGLKGSRHVGSVVDPSVLEEGPRSGAPAPAPVASPAARSVQRTLDKPTLPMIQHRNEQASNERWNHVPKPSMSPEGVREGSGTAAPVTSLKLDGGWADVKAGAGIASPEVQNRSLLPAGQKPLAMPVAKKSEGELRYEIEVALVKAVLEIAEEAEKLEKALPGKGYIAGALGAAALALAPGHADASIVGSSARRAQHQRTMERMDLERDQAAKAAQWNKQTGGKSTIGPAPKVPLAPENERPPSPEAFQDANETVGAGSMVAGTVAAGLLRRKSLGGHR